MSHFTVLVIGDDVEGQLAPYDENLGYDEGVEEWEGNPNAKWDWYVIGGRWTGYFLMKPGEVGIALGENQWDSYKSPEQQATIAIERLARADQARKGQIDWAGMKASAVRKNLVRYDKIHEVIAGRTLTPWEAVRAQHGDNIEAARKAYHDQQILKDLNASKDEDVRWASWDIQDWLVPRDEFIANVTRDTGVTFAVVRDGKWYQKGQMGWFAFVSDEKEDTQWADEFQKLIEDLPDETLMTIVDCHI